MGLYPDGWFLLLFLGMGTALAIFQSLGNIPVVIDKLNKRVREGAILLMVSLSILTEMLSGPLAFSGFRLVKR